MVAVATAPTAGTLTGAIGGGVAGAAFGPLLLGIGTQAARQRFPQISPGDLLGAALQIQQLSERGLTPVASTDPFTGNLVISTAGQAPFLGTILAEQELARQTAPLPGEIAEIRQLRDLIIRARAGENLSGIPPVQAIAPNVVTTPTAREVSPGVVMRGRRSRAMKENITRLAGTCAGPLTGAQRIACGRGGLP